MTLHRRPRDVRPSFPRARVAAYAALATLAGCASYEQSCELNPYACAESDPACGPCEVAAGSDCAPVALPSDGTCGGDGRKTCSPDLECKTAVGEPCKVAAECATGVCDTVRQKCVSCDENADCKAHPDRPLCDGGWCRRPAGGDCVVGFACASEQCVNGLCTK